MTGVTDNSGKFMTGVIDIGHYSIDTNISENAHKNGIIRQPNNEGPGGKRINEEKPEVENLLSVYLYARLPPPPLTFLLIYKI